MLSVSIEESHDTDFQNHDPIREPRLALLVDLAVSVIGGKEENYAIECAKTIVNQVLKSTVV